MIIQAAPSSQAAAADFLPYGRQTITEADIAAVEAVLRSPFLTQGPAVPAFEQCHLRVAHRLPGTGAGPR